MSGMLHRVVEVVVILLANGCVVKGGAGLFSVDPTLRYTTEQLIRAAGYSKPETHFTTTEDGYVLHMARVSNNSTGPPVLLMHALAGSSDVWVLQGRKRDLALLLVDAGYDVWLGDVRGNFYSRHNVRISPSDPKFWDYSFHEMGFYDVPALVDYILKTTGYQKLSYVGHSMGTAIFFVMGSERPEYMPKINIFIAFSPVATMNPANFSREQKIVMKAVGDFLIGLKMARVAELGPRYSWAPLFASVFCAKGRPTQDLCYDLVFFWAGNQAKRMSRQTVPLVLSHMPAGLSVWTPLHFVQYAMSGNFQQRDLGFEENLKRYKSAVPPRYTLSKVSCPIALFYSRGDFLVNAGDVRKYMKEFPNVVYTQEHPDYNHIDYAWGKTAWKDVYLDVMRLIEKFSSQ